MKSWFTALRNIVYVNHYALKRGKKQRNNISSWRDFYQKFCFLLHSYSPKALFVLAVVRFQRFSKLMFILVDHIVIFSLFRALWCSIAYCHVRFLNKIRQQTRCCFASSYLCFLSYRVWKKVICKIFLKNYVKHRNVEAFILNRWSKCTVQYIWCTSFKKKNPESIEYLQTPHYFISWPSKKIRHLLLSHKV